MVHHICIRCRFWSFCGFKNTMVSKFKVLFIVSFSRIDLLWSESVNCPSLSNKLSNLLQFHKHPHFLEDKLVIAGCVLTWFATSFCCCKQWWARISCNSSNYMVSLYAMFTLNVNYIQLNYDSIYRTPFDFIQLWFCSHLRKFKQSRRDNLAI